MLGTVLLFRDALIGSLIIAVACSVLGVYVVLRKIVFVGAALAQLSSMGIALALWLGGVAGFGAVAEQPVALALVVTLIGAMLFGVSGARTRIPPDATIGATYAIAGALGILLIAKASHGEAHDLFLQGNILGITRRDMWVLLAVAAPILLVHVLFYKEFLFISFDRETARTVGYQVTRWNLFLYLTLGLVISFAMQFAGVMLVFNFLVLPAVTGLLATRSMSGTFGWAIGSGLIAAIVGFSLSVPFDLPTGPAMIAVSGVLLFIAWLIRLRQR
jgi:zinc transport system permease protein